MQLVKEIQDDQIVSNKLFHYLGPATVMDILRDKCLYQVMIHSETIYKTISALLAVSFPYEPLKGDLVLLIVEGCNTGYIIGKLSLKEKRLPTTQEMQTKTGITVRIISSEKSEQIEVVNEAGQLVCQYYPEIGKTVLSAPLGDVEVHSPSGNISFVAKKDIHLRSEGRILIEGDKAIHMKTGISSNELDTAVELDYHNLRFKGNRIGMMAEEGNFVISKTKFIGNQFIGKIGITKLMLNKFERAANMIVEKAKNVYRQVEGLQQTSVGRMKTLVKGICHIKGERTYIKSEKDVKINGKKIHLG